VENGGRNPLLLLLCKIWNYRFKLCWNFITKGRKDGKFRLKKFWIWEWYVKIGSSKKYNHFSFLESILLSEQLNTATFLKVNSTQWKFDYFSLQKLTKSNTLDCCGLGTFLLQMWFLLLAYRLGVKETQEGLWFRKFHVMKCSYFPT